MLAAVAPVSFSVTQAPETSFYIESAALMGWGAILVTAGATGGGTRGQGRLAAAGGLLLFLLIAWNGGLACGLIAAGTCLLLGIQLSGLRLGSMKQATFGLFAGYTVAGVIGMTVCAIQFFAPAWADNVWIASSPTAGRAVGNLRQPNLQAMMLIWGAVAAAGLAAHYAGLRRAFPVLLAGIIFAVALTGSRTGMVLSGLLLLWGGFDRLLPQGVRWSLAAAPFMMGASMAGLSWWTHEIGSSYFAETRAHSGSDISSSRFAIWSNTLELIRAQPWTGIGWGNFNFAWTLTEFSRPRPVAFFDHTHNLPLQLAVELGIPATVLICGGFLWLSWRARHALWLPDTFQAGIARAAAVMLTAVLFHSLLEYPLWYPYFLLPSAFLWGLYLGLGGVLRPPRKEQVTEARQGRKGNVLGAFLMAAGTAILAGTLYALWDYQNITQIFAPHGPAGARPLQERIQQGQRSRLFGIHADYAAVTTAARPSEVFEAFERPLHRLIDARLMIAYARALEERGERDKAVYVAQRLREFRHPLGETFFAACKASRREDEAQPFQCETRPVRLTFRDLEVRGR